jgi:hypothetical protein
VRGNLWITDFGLAHCQSQVGLTMSGDLVGTLRRKKVSGPFLAPAFVGFDHALWGQKGS